MSGDPILVERDGDVAELVLNRPERRNALDQPAVAALGGALDELEKNPPRALLLRGEGKGFCAGRDLSDAEPFTEDGEAMKQRGREAGATGWLVKPFHPDQLRHTVRHVLGTPA